MIRSRRRVARRNRSRIRFSTACWRYTRNAPTCFDSKNGSLAKVCCSASWTKSLVSMSLRTHCGRRPRAHRRSQGLHRSDSASAAGRQPRRARSKRRCSEEESPEAGSPGRCDDAGVRSFGGTTAHIMPHSGWWCRKGGGAPPSPRSPPSRPLRTAGLARHVDGRALDTPDRPRSGVGRATAVQCERRDTLGPSMPAIKGRPRLGG